MNRYHKNPHRVRQMKDILESEKDRAETLDGNVISPQHLQNTIEMIQGTNVSSKKRTGHRRFGRGQAIKNPHKRSTVDVSKSFEDIHKLNEQALRLLAKQ